MLLKDSLQIKSSGFSTPGDLFSNQNGSGALAGLLQPALRAFRQSPFMVTMVAGFLVASLTGVAVIYSLVGGTERHGKHPAVASNIDASALEKQLARAKIKYELNVIALGIIEGESWTLQQLADFASGWDRLDALEKFELKQTVWFQSLEHLLERNDAALADSPRAKSLAQLSSKLGLKASAKTSAIAANGREASQVPPVVTARASKSEVLTESEPMAFAVATAPESEPNSSQPVVSEPAGAAVVSAQAVTSTASEPSKPVFDKETAAKPSASNGSQLSSVPEMQSEQQLASAPAEAGKPNRVNRIIRTPFPPDTEPGPGSESQVPSVATQTISDSELRRLTVEFVNSYENGNIITFSSLFAERAVSNEATDLETIRKEYAGLFATTSERRMIIGDIKWNLGEGSATGEGKMKVSVKASGARAAQTYSGTVRIVVEKQADGVQITRLDHELK